ncbi:MAG: molybdenum cofactor biosynthesis protein MoaE [Verrucomicrobiota bacterium]|nr:molybdenum cofactor biosynthesis protein MoaE [Verrucomicrobiota bacterium]
MANYVCEVELVEDPLTDAACVSFPGAGALVEFRGNVRPLEDGEAIDGIDYEANREMARHQLREIANEGARQFQLLAVVLHHRIGFVAAGESSLLLRVASPHRAAALEATAWMIDELKKRVPIWKLPKRESASAVSGTR